jgi:hypothetical protein
MNYANFEGAITEKHGIVIENWPLKTFYCPSDIKSRNKVKVLLRAWESGITHFRLMSAQEWEGWSEARFQQALDKMSDTTPGATENTTPSPTEDNVVSSAVSSSEILQQNSTDSVTPPTQASMTTSTSPQLPDPTPNTCDMASSSSAPSANTQPPGISTNEHHRKKRKAVASDNFMNTTAVTTASGTAIVMSRKTRKTRSNKGVKRKRVENVD